MFICIRNCEEKMYLEQFSYYRIIYLSNLHLPAQSKRKTTFYISVFDKGESE